MSTRAQLAAQLNRGGADRGFRRRVRAVVRQRNARDARADEDELAARLLRADASAARAIRSGAATLSCHCASIAASLCSSSAPYAPRAGVVHDDVDAPERAAAPRRRCAPASSRAVTSAASVTHSAAARRESSRASVVETLARARARPQRRDNPRARPASASARPMPELAPVTIIVRASSGMGVAVRRDTRARCSAAARRSVRASSGDRRRAAARRRSRPRAAIRASVCATGLGVPSARTMPKRSSCGARSNGGTSRAPGRSRPSTTRTRRARRARAAARARRARTAPSRPRPDTQSRRRAIAAGRALGLPNSLKSTRLPLNDAAAGRGTARRRGRAGRARTRCRPSSRASSRNAMARRCSTAGCCGRARDPRRACRRSTRAPDASQQRVGEPLLHSRGILRRCGLAQVGELVAEIPREQRRMTAHALADAPREEHLRAQQLGIGVEVADAVSATAPSGDRAKAAVRGLAVERPRRQPVDAAHVAAEERRHRAQPGAGDELHHRVEAAQRGGVHRARLRAERPPTSGRSARRRGRAPRCAPCPRRSRRFEALPHVHRAAARPIVDAEKKSRHVLALSLARVPATARG